MHQLSCLSLACHSVPRRVAAAPRGGPRAVPAGSREGLGRAGCKRPGSGQVLGAHGLCGSPHPASTCVPAPGPLPRSSLAPLPVPNQGPWSPLPTLSRDPWSPLPVPNRGPWSPLPALSRGPWSLLPTLSWGPWSPLPIPSWGPWSLIPTLSWGPWSLLPTPSQGPWSPLPILSCSPWAPCLWHRDGNRRALSLRGGCPAAPRHTALNS